MDTIVHSAKKNGQSNTNQRCRNERKEKAQKSLRSHWAVRILFWRSFYICNCATGRIEPFSCIPEIMQQTSDCLEWNAAV